MKVKYLESWNTGGELVKDLSALLARELYRTCAEGQLERAAEVAERASEALAQLIALLADKGLISPQEAMEVVGCNGTVTVIGEES